MSDTFTPAEVAKFVAMSGRAEVRRLRRLAPAVQAEIAASWAPGGFLLDGAPTPNAAQPGLWLEMVDHFMLYRGGNRPVARDREAAEAAMRLFVQYGWTPPASLLDTPTPATAASLEQHSE